MARILIIDDDVQFLKMLRQMLERAGYEIVEASNGKIGIKLFRENPTDLIITDIFMPDKDGLETIMELKQEFPAIKIIAMSGGGQKNEFCYLDIAKIFGVNRSLNKPFERQEILQVIEELVG